MKYLILVLVLSALFVIINSNLPKRIDKQGGNIPKIIHMMWISKDSPYENVEPPEKTRKYIDTWVENNPDFKIMYWSGKDVIELIQDKFPQYEKVYTKMDKVINKCDFARFVVMSVFGGVYVDLDFYCTRDISPLIEGTDSYFVTEPDSHTPFYELNYIICNGIFGADKNHDFVNGWLEEMSNVDTSGDVLETTGPIGLTRYYIKSGKEVYLGNTCNVIGINKSQNIEDGCSEKDFYAYTIWKDGSDWNNIENPHYWLLFIVIFFLLLINK